MRRHQRRGCVGATNTFTAEKEQHNASSSHGNDHQGHESAVSEDKIKKEKRKQFRLPDEALRLPPITAQGSPSPTKGYVAGDESASSPVEDTLSKHITLVQHDTKSFKDEAWYRSPIGYGSKASVLLSALKQHDENGTGFIVCNDIIKTLKMSNFGMKEHEIRTLLSHYNPTLTDDSPVHCSTFVRRMKIEEKEEHLPDLTTQHQTYMQKIRDCAAALYDISKPSLQRSKNVGVMETVQSSATSPTKSLAYSPSVHNLKLDLSPNRRDEVDRNSFEFDKQRKEIRAVTKARILNAHLNRVQEFARDNDMTKERQENLALAAKAMRHHDHLARVYEEAHFHLRHPYQCKGLINSEATRFNRSISKDSMFYSNDHQSTQQF